tara:strand:- start:2527 stop:3279 length:753 start_codon:yes stop_codon:yes gene_type:complete
MIKNISVIYFLSLFVMSCGVPKNEHKKLKEELLKVTFELKECTSVESNHSEHNDNHSMNTLSVEKRIAFMSGHVEAGLALYRAGKPDQASRHLMHPVSETHQAERAGIDALGFTPEVFKSVSIALDQGRPASEIEPMLVKAEENILLLQKNSGGDLIEIITFLMEKVVEEYNEGVSDGKIVEAGEYQDAFGFSVVALKMSKRIKSDRSKQLVEEAMKLVKMWPEIGPLADSKPKLVKEVFKQTENIIKNL